MVVVCRLTKMAHFIKCKTTDTAETTADRFIEEVFKHHGLAEEYRSDRDTKFTSRFWTRVWSRLGTTLALSTAYHHQTAGQVERVNQEIHKYLRIYMKSHKDWGQFLHLAEFTYNSTENKSIGCTPFELNKGFQPKTPEILMSAVPTKGEEKEAETWLTRLRTHLTDAKWELEKSYKSYKKQHDSKKRRTKDASGEVMFAPVGSMVYLATKDMQELSTIARDAGDGQDEEMRKFLPLYLGPFEVTRICGTDDLNRQLKLSPTLQETMKSDIFHVSKLKIAWQRDAVFYVNTDIPPPPKENKEGEHEFFVEKIINCEDRQNGRYFRVKWQGYNEAWNTWEHESNMENAKAKVTQFLKKNLTAVNPNQRQRVKLKKGEQLRRSERINTSATATVKTVCTMITIEKRLKITFI